MVLTFKVVTIQEVYCSQFDIKDKTSKNLYIHCLSEDRSNKPIIRFILPQHTRLYP